MDAVQGLLREVEAIERCGGQMTADGKRRRSPGGVLWNILRPRVKPQVYRDIMAVERDLQQRRKKRTKGFSGEEKALPTVERPAEVLPTRDAALFSSGGNGANVTKGGQGERGWRGGRRRSKSQVHSPASNGDCATGLSSARVSRTPTSALIEEEMVKEEGGNQGVTSGALEVGRLGAGKQEVEGPPLPVPVFGAPRALPAPLGRNSVIGVQKAWAKAVTSGDASISEPASNSTPTGTGTAPSLSSVQGGIQGKGCEDTTRATADTAEPRGIVRIAASRMEAIQGLKPAAFDNGAGVVGHGAEAGPMVLNEVSKDTRAGVVAEREEEMGSEKGTGERGQEKRVSVKHRIRELVRYDDKGVQSLFLPDELRE
eukprot:TRINITY_DN8854_c0_g1_i6.p1 TRINITY_DN8854_c0_g1~~TRINITY_DN8854_c0_g1_i6.p1  ORF type:complete len:385 (-),score=66.52 TRINITY_DN8854_c0_g1_i6:284-1396(-)